MRFPPLGISIVNVSAVSTASSCCHATDTHVACSRGNDSMANPRQPKRCRTDGTTDLIVQTVKTGLQLATQAREHGISNKRAADELHKYDKTVTQFGPLYTTLQIPVSEGEQLGVDCLNPFAFLWLAAETSEHCALFFKKYLAGTVCRIAFYNDSVKPGNVLRPDAGRTFEAIYWTFMEFPDWFRSQVDVSWFPLCFIEAKKVADIPGAIAKIAKAVVHQFFPEDVESFNFHRTGVILRDLHVRAQFGCWLADEKAIKEIVSCKGASGYKPCVSCKNVVNRTTPGEADYLVHISCNDTSRFDRHTVASLALMADDLAAKKGISTHAEFSFLEKAYGLVYDPAAMLFDAYTRTVVQFPVSIFWDWMHCLLASGGVAQYECNQFLRALMRSGISLKDVDEFCMKIATPSCQSKLTKTFFRDRVVDKQASHLRAFASEMLSAIQCLGIFVDVVVRPVGILELHIACFDRLRELVLMLSRGDQTCRDVNKLMDVIAAHHMAFEVVYADCVKPKLHYIKHSVECIAKFNCNLNCFGPERKHKAAKKIAAYSYNKVLQ